MDISSWRDTWGRIKWKKDPEDKILQEIKDFYRAGVDFNMEDLYCGGKTPLMYAAEDSTPKVIDLLVGGGANPNLADNDNWTALHYATRGAKIKNVKCCLEHASKNCVNKKDVFHSTALHTAIHKNYVEIAKLLIESGATDNFGAPDKKITFDEYAPTLDEYKPVLHFASTFGRVRIIRALIDAGFDINIRRRFDGTTALHWAAAGGCVKVITELLECPNIDINAQDKEGWTALHVASNLDRIKAVKALIEHGIDVNIKNRGRKTALDIAHKQKIVDIIRDSKQIRDNYLAVQNQPKTVARRRVKKVNNDRQYQ